MASLIEVAELQTLVERWRTQTEKVALVPTMGALHSGHLSLVKQARQMADRVVVSIFVNPKQFGPNEDFSRYPRTIKSDLDALSKEQVDAVFMPNAAAIYPDGFQTYVTNEKLASELCGRSRPGHFSGVLTIVMKLLNLVRPDVAVFGKKDYQQFRLIEKMVEDLAVGVNIVGGDIVREESGLALSSRNRYLDDEQKNLAANLSRALFAAQTAFESGERMVDKLLLRANEILDESPGIVLEYLELRNAKTLQTTETFVQEKVVLLLAAKIGAVRLIDNVEFGPKDV